MIGNDAQALGIEVRQPEMTNFALALQIGEMFERVEIAPVAVVPPMELQKVEAIDSDTRE